MLHVHLSCAGVQVVKTSWIRGRVYQQPAPHGVVTRHVLIPAYLQQCLTRRKPLTYLIHSLLIIGVLGGSSPLIPGRSPSNQFLTLRCHASPISSPATGRSLSYRLSGDRGEAQAVRLK